MPERARDLEGRVAIVTGSGVHGGIGQASATALAEAGASVVLCDLPGTALADVTAGIAGQGGTVASFEFDVTQEEQCAALVQFAVEHFGRLDILHNNAAATNLVHADRDVATLDADVLYGMFGATIYGPMFMCKHAINVFLAQGGGVIINGSSGQSLRGDNHGPAYAASKAALNSLTRSIAVQYGKQNIRANTIATGIIQTALMKQVIPPDMATLYRSHVLTPDLGDPIDIAEAVVFLASDRSRYITGQTLQVDGGILDQTPYVAMLRTLSEDQQHLQASEQAKRDGLA